MNGAGAFAIPKELSSELFNELFNVVMSIPVEVVFVERFQNNTTTV
jgi:hypothetical protein